MICQASITEAAKGFREKMFPDNESDFLLADLEFIERFDSFAFDEGVAQVQLPLLEQANVDPAYESRMIGGEQAEIDIFGESFKIELLGCE